MNCHQAHRIFAALFAAASLVQAQETVAAGSYRDPSGKFELSIPAGWTTTKGPSGDIFCFRSAEMRLATSKEADPAAAVTEFVSEIDGHWKRAKEATHGEGKIAGQRSVYQVWTGINQKGHSVITRITAVAAGGQTYAFLTTAEGKDWLAVRPGVEIIERSFTLPGPPPGAGTPEAPANLYQDPQGRFQLAVPEGWSAKDVSGSASIWRGTTYVNLVPLNGPPAPGLLSNLSSQFGQKWKDFRQIQTGQETLGGIPAEFGMYSGANPEGVPAMLKIVAAGASGRTFVMMMSVPQSEWESSKAELQQMEQSFSVAGVAAQAGPNRQKEPAPAAPLAPAPVPAASAALSRPSESLRTYQGPGFAVSVPNNWTVSVSHTGMTTYLAAPDGKREIEGGMTVLLGMIVGYQEPAPGTDLKSAADQQIRDLQARNPGARILLRQPTKVGELAAESLLVEGPSGVPGEMERTWLIVALQGSRTFFVSLTSPVRDYESLRGLFGQIVASVRLTAL